jgi:protein phosphatase
VIHRSLDAHSQVRPLDWCQRKEVATMSTTLETVHSPAFAVESAPGRRLLNADAVADSRWSTVHCFVVADGIGDNAPAAAAALVGAQVAGTAALHTSPADAVLTAQRVLRDQPAGDCVLVLAKLDVPRATYEFAWVGDCRAYYDNGRVLAQVTADHTMTRRLADRGIATGPRMWHVVTDSVRTATSAEIGTARLTHARGRVLLCSDGVHDGVGMPAVHRILATGADPRCCAAALVAAAVDGGSTDNATAMVIDLP